MSLASCVYWPEGSGGGGGDREKQRERQRDGDRDRDRETERETETERDRETERQRETERATIIFSRTSLCALLTARNAVSQSFENISRKPTSLLNHFCYSSDLTLELTQGPVDQRGLRQ